MHYRLHLPCNICPWYVIRNSNLRSLALVHSISSWLVESGPKIESTVRFALPKFSIQTAHKLGFCSSRQTTGTKSLLSYIYVWLLWCNLQYSYLVIRKIMLLPLVDKCEANWCCVLTLLLSSTSKLKTVHLQGFWPKTVYLKCFGTQEKPCIFKAFGQKPCISSVLGSN